MISPEEFQKRRASFLSLMDDNSFAVIFSGVAKKCSADETYPFEVNRNFHYLTGITQEDSVLLLIKSDGEEREYLLISPFDPVKEKWYGKRLTPEEATAVSGVRNVLLRTALTSRIETILTGTYSDFPPIAKVYLDLEKEQKVAEETYVEDYRKSLEVLCPHLCTMDAYPLIVSLRMVKSPAEIEELRAAIEVTKVGITSAMARIRPGVYEYEIANEFHKVINDCSGYQGTAFPTILASGVHAACLHYPTPVGTVGAGELVLMDLGSRNNLYCADVSRTVPADGVFSELQKTIYSIVLAANKAVANFARPGRTLAELQSFTVEYLASECLSKRLIQNKEDIKNYYFHGVSHHIGLDTHDPGDPNKKKPLVAGNVISDEPGLYFKELGIGVRIEDDLLITEDGCEVLTKDIIKEVNEIEAFYRKSH
ncbi:MAG: aminopeptidase P N-terminal domain-containing protein [Bacilli bacterium]|nr:aminopeptidase P N-terminal domain-containing protein [Bacilli bacterium]